MLNIKRLLFWLALFCVLSFKIFAQNIGGIINLYTPVTAINCNTVQVLNNAGFSFGDKVLIIQMKGAIVDTSNTINFGTITNLNNCGNFEFATVFNITGSDVVLQNTLLNNYSLIGYVQLIRVPQYTNATVNSALSCLPWNGLVGGVLVFEVSGNLVLNNNIDVSGKGFRGGIMCQNPDGSCGIGYTDFFYSVNSGFGAEKGEGISVVSSFKNGGRGSLANGGGGGNKHNSGGAGGGNYTNGGFGGKQADFCSSSPIGGIGGVALNYSGNKIYLGGGGGCSDNNNSVGTTGTNGGGIIIIKANTIAGNSNSILSNGINQVIIPNGIGDGSGGGGAGGGILLNVSVFSNSLNISANGGNGGGQNTNYPACFGPGGGGGTGIVFFSTPTLPNNINVSTIPGTAGIDVSTSSNCYNTSYGATSGQTGSGLKFNAIIPQNTNTSNISVSLGNDTTLACSQNLTLSVGIPGANYLWSTGATSPSITVSLPGKYWVSASVCGALGSDTILISTNANSTSVNLGNDITFDCSQTLTLSAGIPGANYLWSTGETTSSILISDPGMYWIYASICGFSSSDTLLIKGGLDLIKNSEIPNVITPNGDFVNDVIHIGDFNGPELNMAIYNRWGEKVFSETNKLIKWNAIFKNEILSSGTYFWVLEYKNECSENKLVTKKGYITVIH